MLIVVCLCNQLPSHLCTVPGVYNMYVPAVSSESLFYQTSCCKGCDIVTWARMTLNLGYCPPTWWLCVFTSHFQCVCVCGRRDAPWKSDEPIYLTAFEPIWLTRAFNRQPQVMTAPWHTMPFWVEWWLTSTAGPQSSLWAHCLYLESVEDVLSLKVVA